MCPLDAFGMNRDVQLAVTKSGKPVLETKSVASPVVATVNGSEHAIQTKVNRRAAQIIKHRLPRAMFVDGVDRKAKIAVTFGCLDSSYQRIRLADARDSRGHDFIIRRLVHVNQSGL
jgi:hypothetical protein